MDDDKNYDFSKDLSIVPVPYEQLNLTQRSYIDWKAVGGLVTDDEGGVRKMPLTELAHHCQVSISAFQAAKNTLPNFWDLVAERRKVMAGQTRLEKVHNAWYLRAAKGEFQHMQLYLANFDKDFKMPQQRNEIEAGNSWASLISETRKQNVVEGEVVNGETANN